MTTPPTPAAGRTGDQPPSVPAGLRERVLQASLARRTPGRHTPQARQIPPLEAFSRAAEALDRLLSELTDREWSEPVLRDLDVQGLVGHLIGVEEDVRRCLTGDPGVADADHVSSTQPSALLHRGVPPTVTRAHWREAVAATRSAFVNRNRAPGPAEVALHGMRLPPDALLVVRAFELWTHENDIRRATGRPASVPDDSTLALMTGLASAALPAGATRIGLTTPIGVRLVLTGPGGGTWEIRLGPDAPVPVRVGIVTDAVGFCRLVSNRLDPGQLDVSVTGDASVLDHVLAAAAALALD